MNLNNISIFGAVTKAHMAVDMLKAENSDNPEFVGSRDWDTLFEMGDGGEVVKAFLLICYQDEDLRNLVKKFDRYIGIENWINNLEFAYASEPPLEMVISWIKWYRAKYKVSLKEAEAAYDNCKALAEGKATSKKRPAIVVYTNGGTFETVAGTILADVAVVDFDTDGGSEDCIMQIPNGEDIYLSNFATDDNVINIMDEAIITELRKRNAEEDRVGT